MAYKENEARALVIEAGHRLLKEQLIARTWGNISARISEDEFVITPSGRAYDTLKAEDLVKVRISDGTYAGEIKPSSEKGIHAAAYRLRGEVNFVIHTHQFFASAVCAEGHDTSFAPCASYGFPGTKKLKKAVEKTIAEHPGNKAFLMARHGALCLGTSCDDAFSIAENLEENCKDIFLDRVCSAERCKISAFPSDCVERWSFAVWEKGAYAAEYSRLGKALPAYIDDFAQIIGPNARISSGADVTAAMHKLAGRNAVLVRGYGALCVGKTADDAEAAAMILSKNAAAAMYVRNTKPISLADAELQRLVYLKKYSREKDK